MIWFSTKIAGQKTTKNVSGKRGAVENMRNRRKLKKWVCAIGSNASP
jgi:hypothetical protein